VSLPNRQIMEQDFPTAPDSTVTGFALAVMGLQWVIPGTDRTKGFTNPKPELPGRSS